MCSAKTKLRGRGYSKNPANRFAQRVTEFNEGIASKRFDGDSNIILTELAKSNAKTIFSTNRSPDVPFERSLNAYRGCEHGCVYCFARPTHSYLDLSPGLDFESRIFFKSNCIELLKAEFAKPSYEVKTISLGNITDCYQPVEKRLGITREILKLMLEYRHPVSLVTKSSLIERDLDVLEHLAEQNLVHIAITITTLDTKLAQKLEPRAAMPNRRLRTIKALAEVGVPTSLLLAPVIPVLTDHEIEAILEAAKLNAAQHANFIMLRLPHELKDLFTHWLETYYPLMKEHILHRLKEMHGGALYRSNFGSRMRGEGVYAEMIEKRFLLACKKFALTQKFHQLDDTKFRGAEGSSKMQFEMF